MLSIGKWNSRDLLQWLTRSDYPRLSLLFRSHASSARSLPSWAGSQAGPGEPPQASASRREQQPQLPVLSHTRKFFWIEFASLCVIRKQECLWLRLAKTSAGGIVRSRQSGFAADKHEELYSLTNVYPSYSNFYSEQNEAANLSSPNFLQRFTIGLEMPQKEPSLG